MEKKEVRNLLAEDESLTVPSIRDFLMRQGFDVLEPVSTAQKAVETAETMQPGFIFMDIRKKTLVPIAFMSGYSDKDTIERVQETFPVAFLIKPLILQKMLDTIERYAVK